MVNTAVYVLNRIGTSSKEDITPFELWTGHKSGLNNLKIVSSQVKVHVPKMKTKKWDERGKTGVMVGYGDMEKQYRIQFYKSHKIKVCTDVEFFNDKYKEETSDKRAEQSGNQDQAEESDQEDETQGGDKQLESEKQNPDQDHEDQGERQFNGTPGGNGNLNREIEQEVVEQHEEQLEKAQANESFEAYEYANPGDEQCAAQNCNQPKKTKLDWIACNGPCQSWYHMDCVGVKMS